VAGPDPADGHPDQVGLEVVLQEVVDFREVADSPGVVEVSVVAAAAVPGELKLF
jgi:hypothetical protein